MPIIDAFLGEIDHEARTTTRVLERVPEDKLEWAPHVKSMSLGKLAWHLATIPQRVRAMIEAGDFDVLTARPGNAHLPDESLVAAYQRHMSDTRAYLTTLSDATLRETFTMRRGEQVMISIPKISVVRTILMNHSYHHRGQLSVYLRLLDVPVPAVYGTSADEVM